MPHLKEPLPGRLIVSVIYSSIDALSDSLSMLERRFGKVQYETSEIASSEAERYREEMGEGLVRRFFSFEEPVKRSVLCEIKMTCRKIEPCFADNAGGVLFRTINIDPGIMTPDNIVMASIHETRHKVYIGNSIFAEIVLIYANGRFVRLPWTSPDFCYDQAIDLFERVRDGFELCEQIL
ncbi:MAG: DUF4416 family protein [candidate division Zixibacteria bacterium]|nr:DUF4416 family protein [candidate division Zixibacteria bacterium]